MGIFNSIRPDAYPHIHPQFVVFAQLCGGLGQVPFFVDVVFAPAGKVVHTSTARLLKFAHREQVVQLSYTIPGCRFSQQGIYLVELHCNGQWVADTSLDLQEIEGFQ
ncbi:MAG: hypothetical protein HYR84_05730 [Planctomycetes bacterium]|nr:hypothetical protein [Planctomycetota bacterium]